MCFGNKFIYIVAVWHKMVPGVNMVESLRRDFKFVKKDNFIFFLDSFEDQTTGLTFGANAAGAQWDGQLNDIRVPEKSSWAPVPRQFATAALAFTGTLYMG